LQFFENRIQNVENYISNIDLNAHQQKIQNQINDIKKNP